MSLFSGIGAFEKALRNLNIDFELVGYSEIDKYASKAYSLIHNVPENLNLGDITKIDVQNLLKNIDLITYSFPCQDISAAGEQKGFFDRGVKTRSGLFFDALRIIQAVQPKITIAENVKNLTSKRFKNEFEIVLNSLKMAGYNNYYAVLNAKNYGVPQNRERVFIVSVRKDIDTEKFEFPKPIELNKRLKDLLEDDVDEKYYLKGAKATIINDLFDSADRLLQIGTLDIKGQDNIKRVYSSEGISPTLTSMQGGNRQPKIIDDTYRNRLPRIYEEYSPCIRVKGSVFKVATMRGRYDKNNYRIRKLTPKECFRLMGFKDRDINILIENNISNTQLYKMAGNSIVVNVLEEIFKSLIDTQIIHTEKREVTHGHI